VRQQVADKAALDILRSHFAPIEHVKIVSDAATNGTTTGATAYGDMAGSSLTVTVPDGRAAYVFLIANMVAKNNTPRHYVRARIRCATDGGTSPYSEMCAGEAATEYQNLNPMWLRTAQTGSKTYNIQWRVEAGGDTATAGQINLYAIIVSYPQY
jgi:uncharacterized protein YukE